MKGSLQEFLNHQFLARPFYIPISICNRLVIRQHLRPHIITVTVGSVTQCRPRQQMADSRSSIIPCTCWLFSRRATDMNCHVPSMIRQYSRKGKSPQSTLPDGSAPSTRTHISQSIKILLLLPKSRMSKETES